MSALTHQEALEIGRDMGISAKELKTIEERIGRVPNRMELAVFAGMWSEHCSYKTTRSRLKIMPKDGDAVWAGPGSHAGVVDVGEGWGLAFKIESHNHPSAVEPYQGAATGVGGILRDIVAQGARPVAVMDSLCFGEADSPRTQSLRDGVIAGIAGYGNAFGVPNLGGRVQYDARYDGNPLVNALAAGLVRSGEMRTAAAAGVGNPVLYVGATTGRDGILGAAFASEELAADTTEQRSHIQVGDPYTGKKLMEAILSFGPDDGLIAGQDMGATGLTCAATEMAEAGKLGIELWLEEIPLREEGMLAEEILVSESQERFLFVLEKGREEHALAHFERYGVSAAIVGRVIDEDRFVATHGDRVVVDLPASFVAEGCPETEFPVAESLPTPQSYVNFDPPKDLGAPLLQLLGSPALTSREEIYSRYDSTVGNRTVRGPDEAEAAVQKLPGSHRGYALTITGRGDVCAADPYLGAKSAIGAALRNLACVGGELLAVTDGLNMGSPTDPVENLRLSETLRGLADGLRETGVPVTGGNVSLYNESPRGAIPPTPMIGAVAKIDNIEHVPKAGLQKGNIVFLAGTLKDTPGYALYGNLMAQTGRPAPTVDLAADLALADFLVDSVHSGWVTSAKDSGAGGLAIALAKMVVRGGVGAEVRVPFEGRMDWALFGEYSGVAWVTTTPAHAEHLQALALERKVPLLKAGIVGGDRLSIAGVVDLPLKDVQLSHDPQRHLGEGTGRLR